tara:strand:+ start:4771 stop:5001 length:231 start_codon:yes stop_codon:yes gene_type:complete
MKNIPINELPEWATWNKNNWIAIIDLWDCVKDSPQFEDTESVLEFSAWAWDACPDLIEQANQVQAAHGFTSRPELN